MYFTFLGVIILSYISGAYLCYPPFLGFVPW